VLKLALASLRYRAAAFIATFLAVLLGASIVIACGGLFETGLRLNAAPQRLDGAGVVVTGSSGFKLPDEQYETVPYTERSGVGARVATELATVPGVASTVADVSFPAVAVKDGKPAAESSTVLSGHDWASAALTPYRLSSGGAPGPGQVVLDTKSARSTGAEPGTPVDIAVNGQSRSFVVAGVAEAGHAVDAPAIFFSASDALQFSAHPDRVDAIGVVPAEGADTDGLAQRITERFPDLTVLTGDERGSAEFVGITASGLPLILLSSLFGGMMIIVMAIVVSATISLSVRQRQRELALLRASGATPRQVQRMVVAETMVVAGLATACALVLGRLAGEWIFTLSAERGVVPAALEFQQGILPFAAGVVVTLLATFASATFAARAATRTRPIQALAEASIPPAKVGPVRRMLAMVMAAATVGMAAATVFLDPDTAAAVGGPAVLTGAIAVALLGPELMVAVVARLEGFVRRFFGQSGALAVINTRSRAVQFAAVLTPITLATAIALGNIYSQTTQNAGAIEGHLDQLHADAVVTSTTGGIAPDLLDAVRGTPGVANASPMVSSDGWIEDPYDSSHGSDRWPLVGITAQDQDSVYASPVVSGSLRDLSGNTVAIPEGHAEDLKVKVGDQITVRFGDAAQAKVTIVALVDSPSGFESLLLPADLLAPHTATGLPAQVLIRAEADQDKAALVSDLGKRSAAWPGVEVGDRELLESSYDAGLGVTAWINYLLAILAIAYAGIATVNTLAAAVLARRREFAVQRLTGATRRQVTRMLLVEGGIVAVAGLVLGTAISLFTVIPTAIAVRGSIFPAGPLWVFLALVVMVFAIVWPVTILTSRLAMKRRPIEAVDTADG